MKPKQWRVAVRRPINKGTPSAGAAVDDHPVRGSLEVMKKVIH